MTTPTDWRVLAAGDETKTTLEPLTSDNFGYRSKQIEFTSHVSFVPNEVPMASRNEKMLELVARYGQPKLVKEQSPEERRAYLESLKEFAEIETDSFGLMSPRLANVCCAIIEAYSSDGDLASSEFLTFAQDIIRRDNAVHSRLWGYNLQLIDPSTGKWNPKRID